MAEFTPRLLAWVRDILPPDGAVYGSDNAMLLLPGGVGWPMRISMPDDEVGRVMTGSDIRIVVGYDDTDEFGGLGQVIQAVIGGQAEESFGVDEWGGFATVGHRVWYAQGERRGIDEGVEVVATLRAPAWTNSSSD